MRKPSIITDPHIKKCFICGSQRDIQLHHVMNGAFRSQADEDGLWVYLCLDHHTGRNGVHSHPEELRKLKAVAQREYEKTHTRQEWLDRYRRNYIGD